MQQSVAAVTVPTAADGIAEAYLALAASLPRQDAAEFALLLLRLALDLRPGLHRGAAAGGRDAGGKRHM